jgi:hypothetical protein
MVPIVSTTNTTTRRLRMAPSSMVVTCPRRHAPTGQTAGRGPGGDIVMVALAGDVAAPSGPFGTDLLETVLAHERGGANCLKRASRRLDPKTALGVKGVKAVRIGSGG